VRITVNSNDPVRPQVNCIVTARCPAPFRAEPAFINFGQLLSGARTTPVETIRIQAVANGLSVHAATPHVRHATKYFSVNTTSTPEGEPEIVVAPERHLRCGDYFDTIDIHFGTSDSVVRVPLHVEVVEGVFIVPSTAFLKRKPAANSFEPIDLLVVARQGHVLPDTFDLVDSPTGFSLEETAKVSERVRRLQLHVSTNSISDSPAVLLLHGAGLPVPLTIDIRLSPEE
jgi:hypothetical protein